MANAADTLFDRFWSKVDRRGPDDCWPWMAGKTKKGGGSFKIGGKAGKAIPARRMAYEIAHGPVPDGMAVRLSCDDRSCCNERHSYLKPIAISPDERTERSRKRHRLIKVIRDPVAKSRITNKTTYIYGLIDPRTRQCRYVGKTVLTPDKRLGVHKWRSKAEGHKGHSMAWIVGLRRDGLEPEVVTLEEVSPGGDWVEAEQFWIEYLRWLGADLCNHSIGGEGQTGFKQTPEMIARRIRRGAEHHSTGKKKPPHVIEALLLGVAKMRSDPVRRRAAYEKQMAGLTPEIRAAAAVRINLALSDPKVRAAAMEKQAAKARMPERRQLASEQSSARWAESRDYIIARQNEGKGDEWKRKQSEDKKRKWAVPGNKMALAMARRRKISDEDIVAISAMVSDGITQTEVGRRFGVDPSTINKILRGHRRQVLVP